MHGVIWESRIDILGVGPFPNEKWERLLDELKAEHALRSPAQATGLIHQEGRSVANVPRYCRENSNTALMGLPFLMHEHGTPRGVLGGGLPA